MQIKSQHLVDHGVYSNTEFKMECNVCSKLTVEITQHYQWLCRDVFVVQFEQTILGNNYLFKVNSKTLGKGV